MTYVVIWDHRDYALLLLRLYLWGYLLYANK